MEKAASSAGGDESAKSGGDAANQKKEESEKFVSLWSKIRSNLYTHVYYIQLYRYRSLCNLYNFLIISYPRCVSLSLSLSVSHTPNLFT